MKDLPIGIFDSGLGGVSVLAEAAAMLPRESFIYYGDSAHAPYGTKETAEVKRLSIKASEFLTDKGIKALLVACNTATSAAINDLRKRFSIPIIGMEPALKPAVEFGREGKIVVMATPVTLREEKFRSLLGKYQDQCDIIPLPCPGLVELIERGCCSGQEIRQYLEGLFVPFHKEDIVMVVLGCTHYIFIKKEVAKFIPGVIVIDGNAGTVKQLKRVLKERDLLSSRPPGEREITCYSSTDSAQFLSLFRRLFDFHLSSRCEQ